MKKLPVGVENNTRKMKIQCSSLSHMQEPGGEFQGLSYSKSSHKLCTFLALGAASSSPVFLSDSVTNRTVPHYSALVSLCI